MNGTCHSPRSRPPARFKTSRCLTVPLATAMLAFLITGCMTSGPKRDLLSEEIPEAGITGGQLRLLLNEFVVGFSGRVERTADEIIAGATEARIQRNALLWKINGIPACFQAASHADALVAHIDLAVLVNQMQRFFYTGAGSDLFGIYQPLAVQTSADLREDLRAITRLISPPDEYHQSRLDFIQEFVTEHPITDIHFNRASVVPVYVATVQEREQALFEVVGTVTETLEGLSSLLAVYAEFIPKQARWQAELMLIEIPERALIPRLSGNFDTITRSTDRMAVTLEEIPDLIREERATVLEEIDRERIATLEAVSEERIVVLNAIREERTAVQDFVRQERAVVLEAVSTERKAALEEAVELIRSEREIILRETDDMLEKTTASSADHAEKLIDHLMWRVTQLLVLAGAALLVLALVYLLLRRRSLQPRAP